ncbi:MAG: ribonuclease HII [Spirochaetota bacterium]
MPEADSKISFFIEKQLLSKKYNIIAGVDEAGRGALAGPLVVGLVIYAKSVIQNSPEELITQIRDSKQLTPRKRTEALDIIKRMSAYVATSVISHRIIDQLNVNRATEYAVKQLIGKARLKPDVIIMDGNFNFNVGIPFIPVIKGDSKSISIASGSIAAKIKRDSIMEKYDSIFSGYLLKKNKGYGTLEHLEAISMLGPCIIHRKTYEPVKGMMINL